ncbi:aspartate 1-decarboxylase [Chloroflexota bacterium]
MRTMLKGKIHRVTVTEANIDYEGSITIDEELMEAADILPYEMVHVLDVDNGSRLQTYALKGDRGSGVICMNGAAARLIYKGAKAITRSYNVVTEEDARHIIPRLVYVDSNNAIAIAQHKVSI